MRPHGLYRFVLGAEITTLTSYDKAIVYNTETYEPVAISRTGIDLKNELAKANIDVSMGLYEPIAREWMNYTSDQSLILTIFRQSDVGVDTIWKGRLAGIKPGLNDIKFTFESVFTSLRRPGLRARFTRACRHALYSSGCALIKIHSAW